jgi:hypothetical protein
LAGLRPPSGSGRTTDSDHEFDPADVLDQIVAASEHLLDTAAGFSDANVRGPSLLPGWSRGHVLTHLARNADDGRNLLVWARTGVETSEWGPSSNDAGNNGYAGQPPTFQAVAEGPYGSSDLHIR